MSARRHECTNTRTRDEIPDANKSIRSIGREIAPSFVRASERTSERASEQITSISQSSVNAVPTASVPVACPVDAERGTHRPITTRRRPPRVASCTFFDESCAVNVSLSLFFDESCSVKRPAMGFSTAPNTTHRYVFNASRKLGTYSLGPQPIHFGGIYIVAWCECSTRTRCRSSA